jgi:exosortase/archaeosortase family protein
MVGSNNMSRFFACLSLVNRLDLFYLLALAPLPIIAYFNVRSHTFGVIVALYGFLLLYLKKHNLSSRPEPNLIQKFLGLIIVVGSFFLHYALVPFIPEVAYYGGGNYATYILGLFLAFFSLPALKAAFTPLFLIVASSSISFVSRWLGTHLSSQIPHFVYFIALILKTLGVNATARYPNIITFHTGTENVDVPIAWECVGVYGTLIFSTILIIIMFEEQAKIKTKTLWSAMGIIGTFIINIIRILMIVLAYRYYGYELAWAIHDFIGGYVLFFAWLVAFFYIFSKREDISRTIRSFRKRLK